jgi:phosphotransferase system HPr (HPr) family protein
VLESSVDRMTHEAEVALPAGVDLHARPAGVLVKTAMRFKSTITLGDGAKEANAKSVLAVMALGARGGSLLHFRADGEDAEAALEALTDCVTSLA